MMTKSSQTTRLASRSFLRSLLPWLASLLPKRGSSRHRFESLLPKSGASRHRFGSKLPRGTSFIRPLIACLFLALLLGCRGAKVSGSGSNLTEETKMQAGSPDHQAWDALLKAHVNDSGWVDYKGFIQDSAKLNAYLKLLSDNPPTKDWSREEQMAYYINAYNAFTVQIVAQNYPVESIKDIGPNLSIPFVNTVWDIKFVRLGEDYYDLNNLEHKFLRRQFRDPRIHFAIVCASYSCPRLLNEAIVPSRLDAQLDYLAKDFLMDERKNKLAADKLELSKIYNWYGMDFKDKGRSLIDFLNQYSPVKISEDAEIEWREYDWSLNEQGGMR